MKKQFFLFCFLLVGSVEFLRAVNSTPDISRVYGDPYTPATPPTQPSGPTGELNITYGDLVSGIPSGSSNVNAQLPGGTARAMQVFSDGTYVMAMSKSGSNSNIGKYNAEGTLLTTTFGVVGIADLGAATEVARAIMIDVQGRILVAGGATAGSTGWLKRVSQDGLTVDTFATGVVWQYVADIAEQTTGKVIAVGYNGANALIARFYLDGTIDPTFGSITTPGYIFLNGGASGLLTLPTVTTGLYSVVVDANNLIYVAYTDSVGSAAHIARFNSVGLLDPTFGALGIANISYLNSPTSPIYMAIDLYNNLVAAAQVGTSVLITSIASNNGGSAAPAFTNTTISSGGNTLTIGNVVTTSDGTNGKILIMGSNFTTIRSRITRLNNTGGLDTTFNVAGTPGYNEFRIGTPTITSTLLGAALSPDGQIYVAGFQTTGVTNTGYVSSLYNNFNTYQISQSPETQEQGIQDLDFGSTVQETNAGIVTPFNGIYRGALQQQANDVIELASGNLLLAMDGFTNTAAQSSMMLLRLLPNGVLDGSFGSGGKLTLPNLTSTNEYITSVLEDGSGNLYVTGYSDDGAIFRKYTSAGILIWNVNSSLINSPGYKGLGVELEGLNRVVLFGQATTTTGFISGYSITTGLIDPTFHSTGTPAGYVLSTDYTGSPSTVLNMGPVFGGIINNIGSIYIAYKDSSTGVVDVAAIFNDAPGLLPAFGVDGIVHDLFSSATIAASNIHVAFNNNFDIVVAVSSGTTIKVALLSAIDGTLMHPILSIPVTGSTSVMINKATGISDGSVVITGYDDGADDTMLVARVAPNWALDTTFNSQGIQPGVFMLKVGDQLVDFNARVATGLCVQSHVGVQQGNLIISSYEKQFASDSTPIIYRVFGQPGTTEVKGGPVPIINVPGDFDITYNGTGIAITYANGASSPTAGQEVKAIREMTGTNIMTVISDGYSSWTTQLLTDSSLDTSYGVGGSVLIVKGNDISVREGVNGMVFDGQGNMLVFGDNALLGGYVKRLLIASGAPDTTFGGFTGDPTTALYPDGTAYGLMDSVEGAAQLSNGNIVIVGDKNNIGTVMMLSPTGRPMPLFGVGGTVTSGSNITSVAVDASNNIYVSVGYFDTVTLQENVRILKLTSTGSPVHGYGVNGVVDPAISNNDNADSIRLSLNQDGQIVVAASFGGSTGQIAAKRFNTDGSADGTFNGDVVFPVATFVTVTRLISLQDGKTLISGYQTDPVVLDNQDYEFVACLDEFGNMDGSFGSLATGLVTIQVAPAPQFARRLYDMNIQTNGGILLAGSEWPAINEKTPLTMRLYGYPGVQAVPQFPGYNPNPAVPNIIDDFFNGTGFADTGLIPLLADGGDVVVDAQERPVLGGYTTDKKLVVARFTKVGILDTTFAGGTGIAQTPIIPNLLSGQYVAVDTLGNIYIGGVTNDFRFILARFTSAGILDTSFGGGIVTSALFANLSIGGYVTIDSLNRPVIGGMSSDGKLVAARFVGTGIHAGDPDIFGASGIASITVPMLLDGGSITTDPTDDVFVSGITTTGTMVAVKFLAIGTVDGAFGTGGIAATTVIPALTAGGKIGIDVHANLFVGGYTTNELFVMVKFTLFGTLDNTFGTGGIAYSNPVDGLKSIGNITVDSQQRPVVGGYARLYDGSHSFIVARFTSIGTLDTILSSTGMGTSGPIPGLVRGGYVSTDIFDDIFAGGITSNSSLVVAELFSGQEIFVNEPFRLMTEDWKIHVYGNEPKLFKDFFTIDLFTRPIIDNNARNDTRAGMNSILDSFAAIYGGQPGWILVQTTYRVNAQFDVLRNALIAEYVTSTDQINGAFAQFNARRAYFFNFGNNA